jgi:predicted dehydrogenase
MRPVRIALCGLGSIGKAHLEVMLKNSQVTVAAIVDPSPPSKLRSTELGVAHFEHLQEAIHAGNLDGVILATPNLMHVPQALQCLNAKIPVLVEKPISDQVDEAAQLVQLNTQTGVPVLIGHHRAHSSTMRAALAHVQSGLLGRLVSFQGSATFPKPKAYFEQGPWRKEPGGGPLLINMIHEVHNMQMLCGRITSVHAITSNAIRGFEVEDTVCIGLSFESGALGTFILSDCAASPLSWEQTSAENKAYPHYPSSNCYHLSGTQGSLSIPTMTFHKFPKDSEPSWFTPMLVEHLNIEHHDPLELQLAHFVDVINQKHAPLVSAQMGLDNLLAVQAIIESAKTGERISL